MKGLGKLIGNELYKLWKQIFIRVIAIIVLVIIIGYPLVAAGLNALFSTYAGDTEPGEIARDDALYYEDSIVWVEEYGIPLESRYYTVCADACYYFADVVIAGENDREWLYEAYADEYIDLCLLVDAMQIVLSGDYSDDVLRASAYAYILTGNYFVEDYYGDPGERDTGFDPVGYLALCEESLGELESELAAGSVEAYLAGSIASLEDTILYFEEELYAVEEMLPMNPTDAELLRMKSDTERSIEWLKQLRAGYELLVAGNYGPGTWQYSAVANVLYSVVNEKIVNLPVSESVFLEDEYGEYGDYYESYDAYVAECEATIAQSDEVMEELLYAVENDVPLPYLTDDSEKLAVRSSITTTVQTVFYLALAIGGTIVATEHSHGTIRMLLIRPRTRAKILWSKFLSGGIALLVLSAFAFLWSMLCGILFHGGGDFASPDLVYGAGGVSERAAILSYLGLYCGGFLRVAFFYTVAFFFSTVCKRTVPAIVLTFVVNGGLNVSSTVALLLYSWFRWDAIKYLPFAYSDLSIFADSLTDSYCSTYGGEGSMLSLLTGSSASMTEGLLPAVGGLWFLVFGVLLTFFSFLVFRRREIKN